MIDYENFYRASVQFLIDYARKNKLRSYILGISGGIDSTVVAAIASEACRILNIHFIGRSLPSKSNDSSENNAADLVGKAFCTNYKAISIEHRVSIIKEVFDTFEREMSRLQYGNIKARFRMMYLYNLASLYRGCVLDTDNRTEHELGFWTIHGDVGDVNCGLIHLWKTEVFELAKWLEDYYAENNLQDKYEAVHSSITLIPTDGNGVSKNDCEQFGLENYNQVDDVLKTMYYNHYPNSQRALNKDDLNKEYLRLIDSYNEQGVDKVMVLHQNSEYKRKESPIYPDKCSVIYE